VRPQDYIREEACTTWDVDYDDKEITVTEMVLKPRDITKEVTYCTTEPVTTTDPVTGHCTTSMQEVTRTKMVKDTIFEYVPEQRKIPVKVAKLVQKTAVAQRKFTIYEWKTDMVQKGCAISAPGGEVANTHSCVVGPKPEPRMTHHESH